jgi:hypothetical protein
MSKLKVLKAFILITFPSIALHSQSLQAKMDSLERKDLLYEYYDRQHKKHYTYGWIE